MKILLSINIEEINPVMIIINFKVQPPSLIPMAHSLLGKIAKSIKRYNIANVKLILNIAEIPKQTEPPPF